jgi:hypothetical protein
MIYFTKYAENKFEILNKYKVYYTREQIIDVINTPEKTGKKGGFHYACKDGIKVVYKKHSGARKIITFYPIKQI